MDTFSTFYSQKRKPRYELDEIKALVTSSPFNFNWVSRLDAVYHELKNNEKFQLARRSMDKKLIKGYMYPERRNLLADIGSVNVELIKKNNHEYITIPRIEYNGDGYGQLLYNFIKNDSYTDNLISTLRDRSTPLFVSYGSIEIKTRQMRYGPWKFEFNSKWLDFGEPDESIFNLEYETGRLGGFNGFKLYVPPWRSEKTAVLFKDMHNEYVIYNTAENMQIDDPVDLMLTINDKMGLQSKTEIMNLRKEFGIGWNPDKMDWEDLIYLA
ncbi:MAG: hypothetical protein PHS54_00690 [Clostridia bacterium]|nr:hypothetical protein [Clostridia bacterium]